MFFIAPPQADFSYDNGWTEDILRMNDLNLQRCAQYDMLGQLVKFLLPLETRTRLQGEEGNDFNQRFQR